MTMLSPRGHTEASRELLLAVTGRTTLDQAHAARVIQLHQVRPVNEDDLCMRAAERSVYREIAFMSRGFGVLDVKAEQEERCQWCTGTAECAHPRCLEMQGGGGDQAPSVVMRRLRAPTPLPSLPWWRRALLWLFPTSTRTTPQ